MIPLTIAAGAAAACITFVLGWAKGHDAGTHAGSHLTRIQRHELRRQADIVATQAAHIATLRRQVDAAYRLGHDEGMQFQRSIDSAPSRN